MRVSLSDERMGKPFELGSPPCLMQALQSRTGGLPSSWEEQLLTRFYF
jgi:hypothetical protein